MGAARYRINGQAFEFVSVNPVYWLVRRVSDDTLWRAYGGAIRSRMGLDRHAD
jgi:hypothetical protein